MSGSELVQQLTADVSLYRELDLGFGGVSSTFRTEFDQNVYPVGIDISRSFDGLRGENATVKVIMEKPDELEAIESIDVIVEMTINGVKIYEGKAIKATEDAEGVTEITCVTASSKLSKSNVTLDTTEDLTSDVLVQQLLVQEGPFSADDIVINVQHPDGIEESVSLEKTESLRAKLEEIATYQHCYVYVNRDNQVVFTNEQPSTLWKPTHIIDVDAGSEQNVASRVIVETAQSNPGTQLLNNQFSYEQTSSAVASRTGDGAGAGEEKVTDHTITDQSVANQRALSELIADAQEVDNGTVKIPGDPRIDIYDGIIIPELDEVYSLASGQYTIKRVRHKFDNSTGYITEIDLAADLEHVYASTTDEQGLSDSIAEQIYTDAPTEISPGDVNSLGSEQRESENSQSNIAQPDNSQSSNTGSQCTYTTFGYRFYRRDLIYRGDDQETFDQWASCEITTQEYNNAVDGGTIEEDVTFNVTDAIEEV